MDFDLFETTCSDCGGSGVRQAYVPYMGWRKAGSCSACKGSGTLEVSGPAKIEYATPDQIARRLLDGDFSEATPCPLVTLELMGTLTANRVADAFAEIEAQDLRVGSLAMSQETYDAQFAEAPEIMDYSYGDGYGHLWGAEVIVVEDMSPDVALVLADIEHMEELPTENTPYYGTLLRRDP